MFLGVRVRAYDRRDGQHFVTRLRTRDPCAHVLVVLCNCFGRIKVWAEIDVGSAIPGHCIVVGVIIACLDKGASKKIPSSDDEIYKIDLLLIIIALIKPFGHLGIIELLAKENCVPCDNGRLVHTN